MSTSQEIPEDQRSQGSLLSFYCAYAYIHVHIHACTYMCIGIHACAHTYTAGNRHWCNHLEKHPSCKPVIQFLGTCPEKWKDMSTYMDFIESFFIIAQSDKKNPIVHWWVNEYTNCDISIQWSST